MTSQIGDLVEKLHRTETSVQHRCGIGAMSPIIAAARAAKGKMLGNGGDSSMGKEDDGKEVKGEETALAKAVKDR